jgi:hypothetical protein
MIRPSRTFLVVLWGLLGSAAPAVASECLSVFDPLQVLTLNLQLSSGDWDTIRKDTTFEIEVPATFWADGEDGRLTVSVRRKRGKAIPSESNPRKVPLKIDVNEFVDQQWRGLIKISLENGGGSFGSPYKQGDFDVVREGLAWAAHRLASGSDGYGYLVSDTSPAASAAACAAWVRLVVNGTYMGVYVNAEQRDKQFLKNRALWTAGRTWLYEQEDVGTTAIEEGDGDSPTQLHLCYSPFRPKGDATCATPGDVALAGELAEWVNMRAFVAQCAVDAIIDNNDGLCSHGNNMFIADFLGGQTSLGGRTRLYFPWDLDSVFGSTTTSIYARSVKRGAVTQSPYQSAILNHPLFRTQYNDALRTLITASLSPLNLRGFLDQLKLTTLPAALASDPFPTVTGNITDHFNRLGTWITQRVSSINGQLTANGPPPPRN